MVKLGETLQVILLGVFAFALIYFPIAYRIVDKIRMHEEICVRQMSDDLLRWIEKAGTLVSLDENDAEAITKYNELAEQFRKCKNRKEEEKIRTANEIYEVVRMAAIRSYGDERVGPICLELLDIYTDFSMIATDYNVNARRLNEQLEAGVAGLFRKLFHMRPIPILEELTELKY